tara:strand:- start:72 stop:563 length:492 start_codon:yes stop_codon:yes gene_type:complete
MLSFLHAASSGRVANTALDDDVLTSIAGHVQATEAIRVCDTCGTPVLVARETFWTTDTRCVRWTVVRGVLIDVERASYRHATTVSIEGAALHLLTGREGSVTVTQRPERIEHEGAVYPNRFAALEQPLPYFVIGDRFCCCVCSCARRRLRRIVHAWRRVCLQK